MNLSAAERKNVLRHTVAAVLREILAIRKEPVDWGSFREQTLWCELVGCLLGSGVRFEDAVCAVRRLKRSGILAAHTRGRALRHLQKRVANVLITRCTRNDGCIARYRFPHRRAEL